MKSFWLLPLCVFASAAPLKAAVSLYEADSLWLFDQGVIGQAATYTQVVDATARAHVATTTNFAGLTWVAGPTTGPFGGSAQSPTGHAIKFSPVVTNAIAGNSASQLDTVSAATFQSNNATVSGNATIVTRMRWDGAIPNFDDGSNQWLLNNGLQGWNDATKVSGGFLMGLQTDGRLAYYTAGPGTGQTGIGASTSFNTPSTTEARLQVGQWYDVAMVLDDLGTANDATGKVTFYLVGPDGQFQTFESAGNMAIGNGSAANLVVGGENGGTGTSNQRKSFNGALDYLALYDVALSETEIRQLFAVPEPSRVLLLLGGLLPLMALRRR